MAGRYYVGGYWGSRQEPIDVCAQRTVRLFIDLAHCDPLFAHWFKLMAAGDESRREVDPDVNSIRDLLLSGRARRDDNGQVIEELGFHLGLWNGHMGDGGVHISIGCGAYGDRAHNRCVLSGLTLTGGSRLNNASALATVLRTIVETWDPDWGIVQADDYLTLAPPRADSPFQVGWLTYLSSRFSDAPSLPESVRVEPLGMGRLIVLTDELFSIANASHLDAITKIRGALGV